MTVMLSASLTAEITFRGSEPTPRDLRFLRRYLKLSEEALIGETVEPVTPEALLEEEDLAVPDDV